MRQTFDMDYNVTHPKHSERRYLSPRRYAVLVSVPARTSISVIDMNQFAPGRAGGGNVGIALDIRTILSVRIASEDRVRSSGTANPAVPVLCRHVCDAWRA